MKQVWLTGCSFAMLKFHLEHALAPKISCGVDEAGRGPWAGPVVAAAVLFRTYKDAPPARLNDSKKLSAAARECLFDTIGQVALTGIGVATVEEIEALNIWGATSLAMRRAVLSLAECAEKMPDVALIDGKTHPRDFPCATQTVVGGDGISPSIAAASILAKVTRDRMMHALAAQYPKYGFERHAGYGTKLHSEALAAHGVCPAHRRGFAPIRALLEAV